MKQPRVVIIVRLYFPWVNDTIHHAHQFAKILIEKGLDVEVVTGWWFWSTPHREWIEGVPVFRNLTLWEMFGMPGLRRFGGYLYIFSLLWYLGRTRKDYDIIHVYGLDYHTFTAVLAGRWFHKKVISTLAHNGDAGDIIKMHREQRLPLESHMLTTALMCDRFVVTSGATAKELIAEGVPGNHIVQLPNGVETELIEAKTDYEFGEIIHITFMGCLHEQKQVEMLFQGFALLLHWFPALNIRLQLVGDDSLREDLISLARHLKINQKLDHIGNRNNVYSYMKETDILILSSYEGGLSNALLAAMTMGLPVVASNDPDHTTLIRNQDNGLLFEGENPENLAKSVAMFLKDDDLRKCMGKSARRTIREKFSISRVAEYYLVLYNALLGSKLGID